MNNDYEKGYQDGYEACVQLYKKRDFKLLKERYVHENAFCLSRSEFMSKFNPENKDLKAYIDLHTFKCNVKNSRSKIEILHLGDYYLIYETGLIFELNDDTTGLDIQERVTEYIINYYKKKFIESKKV